MTKKTTTPEPVQQVQNSWLAITSLILGILSVTGFGFLTGIPAIITGTVALFKKQDGRGMSIAGIIMGAIGTIVSLLLLILIIAAIVFGVDTFNNSNLPEYVPEDFAPSQDWVESSRT